MSHSLNSVRGAVYKKYIGEFYGGSKGGYQELGYSSHSFGGCGQFFPMFQEGRDIREAQKRVRGFGLFRALGLLGMGFGFRFFLAFWRL